MRLYLVIFLLVFSGGVYAQNNQTEYTLADTLVQLCKEITESAPDNEHILQIFQSIDVAGIARDTGYRDTVEGFNIDSYYSASLDTSAKKEARLPNDWRYLSTYKREPGLYYRFAMFLHSTYDIDRRKVVYSKENKKNISYPSLTRKIGNPVLALIQPKDTRNYYYIYINPKSKRKAVIALTSWGDADSDYNTIYRITISNYELNANIEFILKHEKH
jgi:hypothetical protein